MVTRTLLIALLPACTFDARGVDRLVCDSGVVDAQTVADAPRAADGAIFDAAVFDGPLPDASPVDASPDAPAPCPTYAHVSSWYYRAGAAPQVFTAAEADCETTGGHLVVIGSAAENDAARGFAGENFLTGLSADTTFTYAWVDGSALGYANWHAGRPLYVPGAVRVEVAYGDGTWYDMDDQAVAYLCECEP